MYLNVNLKVLTKLISSAFVRSPLHLGASIPACRIPDVCWMGWRNSWASLTAVAKRKTPLLPELELKSPVLSPALLPTPPYVCQGLPVSTCPILAVCDQMHVRECL